MMKELNILLKLKIWDMEPKNLSLFEHNLEL
jgi:hypothetical protein